MNRPEKESLQLVTTLASTKEQKVRDNLFRKLLAMNSKFIKDSARRNYRPGGPASLSSVEEAALLGFWKATSDYLDIERDREFLEWASHRMREEIASLYLDYNRGGANLPDGVIKRLQRGDTSSVAHRYLKGLATPHSVEAEEELLDSLPDENEDVWANTVREEWSEEINDAFEAMLKPESPRCIDVIILRFGLDGRGPKTLAEIGEILNISRERARQLESKGLYLLRRAHSPVRKLANYLR